MKHLLKPFGAENNKAYVAILEWFKDNPDLRVNENELCLKGFTRHSPKYQKKVAFSAATISRSARKLGEWGLLVRGHDSSHRTWYSMPSETAKSAPRARFRYESVVMTDGRIVMREIPV